MAKIKLFLTFFTLVFNINSFGQKTFTFDYLIEYETLSSDGASAKTLYLLTNSKDNSYHVRLTSEDKETFDFYFHHDYFRSVSSVDMKSFFNAKTVKIPCETVHLQKDKINLKRYDFKIYSDTLVDGTYYKHYSMQFLKSSDERRYNCGKSHYIVQNGTEFHAPLKIFSSAFDLSLTSDTLPDGIAKVLYNTGKNGARFYFKLVSYKKVDKTIEIPNCPILTQ